MKNSILFPLLLLLFVTSIVNAQTTIINPAGDGGFETGSSFPSNNWLTAQSTGGTHSKWAVGTTVVNSGARAAYISSDNGVTNTYSTGTSRVQHFYRDIIIPAGEPYITLTFNWKGQGETNTDYLRVFVVP
ncbi:MAG: hypothetical protein ACRC3B_03560, partial [Bacteroidia bacterium]